MAVCVPPTMLPGLSASIAEVAAMSDSTFCIETISSYRWNDKEEEMIRRRKTKEEDEEIIGEFQGVNPYKAPSEVVHNSPSLSQRRMEKRIIIESWRELLKKRASEVYCCWKVFEYTRDGLELWVWEMSDTTADTTQTITQFSVVEGGIDMEIRVGGGLVYVMRVSDDTTGCELSMCFAFTLIGLECSGCIGTLGIELTARVLYVKTEEGRGHRVELEVGNYGRYREGCDQICMRGCGWVCIVTVRRDSDVHWYAGHIEDPEGYDRYGSRQRDMDLGPVCYSQGVLSKLLWGNNMYWTQGVVLRGRE
ncbi:hypothetical protein Tco_0889099 [Tanacetum coccineum]